MLQSVPMNAQTKVCATAIRQSLCTVNFSLRPTDAQTNRLCYKRILLLDTIDIVGQLAESNLHVS